METSKAQERDSGVRGTNERGNIERQQTLDDTLSLTTDRKLRLFACACCRQVWHLISDERSRGAVDMAEWFADGHASAEDLAKAWHLAEDVFWELFRAGIVQEHGNAEAAARAASWVASVNVTEAAWQTFEALRAAVGPSEEQEHAAVRRDLFGDPGRFPLLKPAWIEWNEGYVPDLARSIYDSKDFVQMPLLAEALMEAGCREEYLLAHCHSERPHFKGCWLLDAILDQK